MLERNLNWRNNRLFCHIFVIGEITIRGGCLPPLVYAYAPIEENKKSVRNFSARFLSFSNEISTVQKIVLSSSRGQGNFRGIEASRPRPRTSKCVLEAKDILKDSTSATISFNSKSEGEHSSVARGAGEGLSPPSACEVAYAKSHVFVVF